MTLKVMIHVDDGYPAAIEIPACDILKIGAITSFFVTSDVIFLFSMI